MSDYYLADKRAQERERQRQYDKEPAPSRASTMKVTLLGDFVQPSSEASGCDPYNSTQGKSLRDAWTTRRGRR